MKKLILSAILLGSISTFAQEAKTTKETKVTTTEATSKSSQENYKEVKSEELPEALKTSLKAGYPDATVTKAYVNDKKEYKMDIAVGDQKATVYADAQGNWLKK
ncbi:hypothetical protein [Flavobacterium sp.]|uniref:hypothetical protein n=1 Tax=Flavobacterium sp. TaxID=239 RepID=UPI00286A9BF2|nr:hypothetical protein [Flavobacterium sp.]